MLLLSRNINEKVLVEDEVEVKVVAVNGNKVLLGFTAPTQVSVHREGVYKKIKTTKKLVGKKCNLVIDHFNK